MADFSDEELAARRLAARLKEERNALGLTIEAAAKAGGVSRTTQFGYESATSSPTAVYLAAMEVQGLDVLYVVTGRRERKTSVSPAERALLDAYARADEGTRRTLDGVAQMARALAELTVSSKPR